MFAVVASIVAVLEGCDYHDRQQSNLRTLSHIPHLVRVCFVGASIDAQSCFVCNA